MLHGFLRVACWVVSDISERAHPVEIPVLLIKAHARFCRLRREWQESESGSVGMTFPGQETTDIATKLASHKLDSAAPDQAPPFQELLNVCWYDSYVVQ